MKITEKIFDLDSPILDIDFIDESNFIFTTEQGHFFINGKRIDIDLGSSKEYWLRVGFIDKNTILLINAVIDQEREKNSWIVNNIGEIEKELSLGPCSKFLVKKKQIIVAYADSNIYPWEYGYGMNFYDYDNKLLNQYNKKNKVNPNSHFYENYAFLSKDKDSFYFMPYYFKKGEFISYMPIVEYNLALNKEKVLFSLYNKSTFSVPKINLKDYTAMAFSKDDLYWYIGSHKIEKDILTCHITVIDSDYNKLETYDLNIVGRILGFQDGKFIIFNENRIYLVEM